jgi:putative methionine-R-sulfoxide reductase with GAF domain
MSAIEQTDYSALSKMEKYELFQITWPSLWDSNLKIESNLCNCYALMRQIFQWWWIGNYWVKGDNLELGVFQGDPVHKLNLEKAFAVIVGKRRKRFWFQTSMISRVTLLVVHYRIVKLWFLYLVTLQWSLVF